MRLPHGRQGGNEPDSSRRLITLGLEMEDEDGEEIRAKVVIEASPANIVSAGETYDVVAEDNELIVTVTVADEEAKITAGYRDV